MKKLLVSLLLAMGLVTMGMSMVQAHPAGERAVYKLWDTRTSDSPITLVVRCDGIAEDSLAILHLVRYEPGSLAVYRCGTP